ncbi:hypothetical protein P3T37_005719 [Kitasatospora sp. MAA4]|uniref:hypothetical protein n=1 Tax=Kitasatospora sp. MAA4 TaxID=3035093 RepID=UPI002476AD63|nr:hypothetical protein [Kitasatospora sp. MAA4]MDH6136299.1 hypothetical protein [Kitasatospora sp. MAA4]
MRTHLSSRFAKNITVAVAALVVAGATAGTAAADDQPNCTGQTIYDRPGEHPVANAPTHHGTISMGLLTSNMALTIGKPWEFTLDEYNGTGADYRNVAVTPSFFGWTEVADRRLGGMTTQNTHLQTLVNGRWKNVPMQTGCDPTLSPNSTLVDHALPAGAHWKQTFRVTVDAGVTSKLTSFQFFNSAFADGTPQDLGQLTVVKIIRPAAVAVPAAPSTPTKPTTPHPAAPSNRAAAPAQAAAVPSAAPTTAAPVQAAPAAPVAPTAPATSAAPTVVQLAPVAAVASNSPSGSAGSGVLLGLGLFTALGGIVSLVALRARRTKRA